MLYYETMKILCEVHGSLMYCYYTVIVSYFGHVFRKMRELDVKGFFALQKIMAVVYLQYLQYVLYFTMAQRW